MQTECSINNAPKFPHSSTRLTRLSDGQRKLGPQLCLQVLVVVRIDRGIKKAVMFAPEIYQHVVHCRTPVWPPYLTSKVCHSLRRKPPLFIIIYISCPAPVGPSHGSFFFASSLVFRHHGWIYRTITATNWSGVRTGDLGVYIMFFFFIFILFIDLFTHFVHRNQDNFCPSFRLLIYINTT